MKAIRWLVALGVALVVVQWAGAAEARRIVYSISVGNNQPPASESNLPVLHYADDDAVRYHELFRRAGEHAALLTVLDRESQKRHGSLGRVQPPTLSGLRAVLASFRAKMSVDKQRGDQPVLFLTYSGHGSVDERQRYFLAFLDGGLTQDMLYGDVLSPLAEFDVHLIVDACNAGGVVGTRGPFEHELSAEIVNLSDEQTAAVIHARTLSRFPQVGALIATSSGQQAHEWSRIESGVFTHEVLSALLGAADVNGDLRVEYSEVQAFVASANRDVADPRAVPSVVAVPPAADPHTVLIDLRTLKQTMLLAAGARGLGRLSVNLPDGRVLIDANVLGIDRLVLALPHQKGIFVQRGEVEAEVPVQKVIAFDELRFTPMRQSARGSIDRALQSQLFVTAFTPYYYQGYVDSHDLSSVRLGSAPMPLPPPDIAPSASGMSPGTRRAVAWSLFGLAAAAVTTSVVTLVLAADAKSEFDNTDLQRRSYELRDEYQRYFAVGVVSAAVGAAAGVGGYFMWPGSERRNTAFGLGWQGRF